jgi:NAD+ synthase (glutamine-hydrolysing)
MTILPFNSPYAHGFVRAAVATPRVRVADPRHNGRQVIDLARTAADDHACLVVFPELGLSGYSNEDLFFQDALLDGVLAALGELAQQTRDLELILVVGAPLRSHNALFNCAVVLHRGQVRGVIPKSYLPNYREFYEKRHFAPARATLQRSIHLQGVDVPFGPDLIFTVPRIGMSLHVEICEDLWVPIPPSTEAALAGANVLVNLSASNVTIGKPDYRRLLCAAQSAKCVAAYLYSGAGPGESTTDLAWDGHTLIYENGDLLQEGERYPPAPRIVCADIDLDRLRQERMRLTSFGDCANEHRARLAGMHQIALDAAPPVSEMPLRRIIDRFPYVPSDPATRGERCRETYNIQVQGLAKRLEATGIKGAVIGVSGGLDSGQALLVTTRAFDRLSLPRSNVMAVTMPGFATSTQTRQAAWDLMRALGAAASEIDIRPSAQQMLKDINHPFARGEPVYDTTFENVQAGERTSHLFRLANMHGGLVVGTGDLSELALGYTTYGVGDHMSHYNVNASVPKTLIRHLIRWAIDAGEFDDRTCAALQDPCDQHFSRTHSTLRPRRLAERRGRSRPLCAAGFPPLLPQPLRIPPEQGGLYGLERLARCEHRDLAGDNPGRGTRCLRSADDWPMARSLPPTLLQDQPVQEVGHAERPQGGLRRLPLSPKRLACAERRRCASLDRRAALPACRRILKSLGAGFQARCRW